MDTCAPPFRPQVLCRPSGPERPVGEHTFMGLYVPRVVGSTPNFVSRSSAEAELQLLPDSSRSERA